VVGCLFFRNGLQNLIHSQRIDIASCSIISLIGNISLERTRDAGSIPASCACFFFFVWPNWRNGSAPAYGAGGCGFEPHVGLFWGVQILQVKGVRFSHGASCPVSIVALYLLWVSSCSFQKCCEVHSLVIFISSLYFKRRIIYQV
jgi:hypothetical protein